MRRFRDLNNRRALVQGRISQLLELMGQRDVEPGEALATEIASLSRRIDHLAEELSFETIIAQINSILTAMGMTLRAIAQDLELEHSDNPIHIDYGQLTVVADTEDGPAQLSEMGSGKNWVGYHIAAHLVALMDWFVRKDRPVPRFMVFDQPTQVYFPPDPALTDRREVILRRRLSSSGVAGSIAGCQDLGRRMFCLILSRLR